MKGKLDVVYMILVSLKAPTSNQIELINDTLTILEGFQESGTLIDSDFNYIMNTNIDRSHHRKNTVKRSDKQNALNRGIENFNPYNVWLLLYLHEKDYSYFLIVHKVHTCIASRKMVNQIQIAPIGPKSIQTLDRMNTIYFKKNR